MRQQNQEDEKILLHPEFWIKGFIKRERTLALRAAGEESASLRRHVPAQHELIRLASAAGTDSPV